MTERLADDFHLFILDEGGIVFRESTQEIYSLNTTATYLWCMLEEGVPADALAPRLVEAFGLSPAKARRYVADSMADWRARGFFRAPRIVAAERPSTIGENSPGEEIPISLAGLPIRQMYRVLGHYFEIGYGDGEAARRADLAIGHLRTNRCGKLAEAIAVRRRGENYQVQSTSQPVMSDIALTGVSNALEVVVFRAALARVGYTLAVHAAAVAVDRRCLLMPGRTGSGKSTLAASLIYNNFKYLTDDLALLHTPGLNAEGVPFSISVKEDDVGPITSLFPTLRDQPQSERWDNVRMRFLSPPAKNDTRRRQYEIGWLVFPRYDPNADRTVLKELKRSDALQGLMETLSWPARLTPKTVKHLVDAIRSAACYDLRYRSLRQATRILAQLTSAKSKS